MFLLINFNVLLALVVSWLICFDQDKSSVIFTPRYFVLLVVCLLFVVFFFHGSYIHV